MHRYIGLMSGTSMDGIDAALVSIVDGKTALEHTHSRPYDDGLRAALSALATGKEDGIHQLGTLDRQVGNAFARAVDELLEASGLGPEDISAIGSHGQTVRHFPSADPALRYSLQIGDPATIAEVSGICTVADFRRQDIAAGGQGAPLVPPFHAAQFGRHGEGRAVVNIGGISNASILQGDTVAAGFDCGPGNTLLDAWIRTHRGEAYDAAGGWAAESDCIPELLERLCSDAFFQRSGPRSTGPEHFNLAWLGAMLGGEEAAGDVQATLAELSAFTIQDSLLKSPVNIKSVYICGGGARNTDLMRRLHKRLEARGIRLGITDELGLAAEWVEASAFAWLAYLRLNNLPGNSPAVTGARGPRRLGAVYPAPSH